MNTIRWQDYIHADPAILGGKPVLKGTRLSLEFLFERLSDGWTHEMLFENFPSLKPEHLQALYDFALQCILDGTYIHPSAELSTVK